MAGVRNKTVTFTGPSKSTEWNFGEVNGAAPKITMTRAETDNNSRTCQHALSATGDLVIEVQACGTDITDGGRAVGRTDGGQGGEVTAPGDMERPPSDAPVGQTGRSGAGWLREIRQRA